MRFVRNTLPAARFRSATVSVLLDRIEQALIAFLYGWLVMRLVSHWSMGGSHANLLLLPSEGLVLFLILVRRKSDQVSRRWSDWVLALLGTAAPLLVIPVQGRSLIPLAIVASLLMMGIFVQVHAKLALGRSIGCVAANRGLKFSGPYQFVRHPMYLGYLLSHIAFLVMNPTLWNVGVYTLCYAFQIPRLMAEEKFLREDQRYREYTFRVPYRLIPGIF